MLNALRMIGVDNKHYSGLFMRRGGISAALAARVPEPILFLQSGHGSNCAARNYTVPKIPTSSTRPTPPSVWISERPRPSTGWPLPKERDRGQGGRNEADGCTTEAQQRPRPKTEWGRVGHGGHGTCQTTPCSPPDSDAQRSCIGTLRDGANNAPLPGIPTRSDVRVAKFRAAWF